METTYRGNGKLNARRLVIAACCAAMIGCQTFTPLGSTGPELQQEIRSGMLVTPGEQVRITTSLFSLHRRASVKGEDPCQTLDTPAAMASAVWRYLCSYESVYVGRLVP